MLRLSAIVLFTLSIIENVCSNTCGHDNCETAIDIPLITKLNAPLKAELDITSLTIQLKELIEKHVNQSVSKAVNDLVENILDKTVQTAVNRVQTSNSVAMATFRQEMEAELEVKIGKTQTILDNKLKGDMKQLKSEVKKVTEKVAVTSCAHRTQTYNSGKIITFSNVKMSNGIGNVNNFKSSGKFTCEKPGLYLIGVYIVSYTKNSEFHIMKNGINVSRVYVRPYLNSADDNHHTGTGIIAVQLDVNDTLNINAYSKMQVLGSAYSCMTIIKVK
ncbi:Hypothetical predicted protein [Mytilus galloprovincialis]|uniref:C1q domain-containing protein n=1 Tax=Mytilus galloprovincialis TaxID=29158 RepID=A0A8B6G0H4_MYTGA|nr:Hypothetical predicted protein [Mytilus galloprovincialis]